MTRPASFRFGTWVATTSNWGSAVALVLVPASLQAVRHASVLETGALFLSFSIAYAITGGFSGPLIRALGVGSALLLGIAVFAAGLALLAIVGPAASTGALLAALAVAGAGNGILYSGSTTYALVDTQAADAGEASGLLTMLRLLGLTLGVALSTSLVLWVDGMGLGIGSAGLRVALGLAAVIVAAGAIPLLARRPARHVQSPARAAAGTGGGPPAPD